jgi:hypothetical protein
MKYISSAQKALRNTERTRDELASAGSQGIAISPSAYGIDLVDRGSGESAPEPDQVHQSLDISHAVAAGRPATMLQRKAIVPPKVEPREIGH